MNRKQLIVAVFLLLTQWANAQELFQRPPYDHIWLFGGDGIRMSFNTDPLNVSITNRPFPLDAANGSICNESGNLLLHTNGLRIGGNSSQIISNGNRINSGEYSDSWFGNGYPLNQGALILKQPESNSLYHIVYGEIEPVWLPELTIRVLRLHYALVDMSLNNEEGEVIEKDVIIINETIDAGKITAVKHGNGRDWWILIPYFDANNYHKFLLTSEGLLDNGQQQVGDEMFPGLGQAVFSPDGSKYVNYSLHMFNQNYLGIYDFNRCTGELSSPIVIYDDIFSLTGGVAISENSRFLYESSYLDLYQIDLEAEDIAASRTKIAEYDGYYEGTNPDFLWTTFDKAQLTPDSRIFIGTTTSARHLHVVQEPNKKGAVSRFEQHILNLNDWNQRTMPNFPYYGLGPWDGSPCDTLNIDNPTPEAAFEHTQDTLGQQIEFFDASHYAYEWEWSFGDGSNPSSEQHPVHTYLEAGAYEVCLQVSNVTGSDLYCETIYIGPTSTQEVFAAGLSVRVSPNPFQDQFSVQLNGISGQEAQLRVYNVAGQKVYERGHGTQSGQIDAGSWPTGLYFYEIWSEGVKLATGKMVKN